MSLYMIIGAMVWALACGLVALGIMIVYFAALDLNARRGKDR